MAWFDVVHLDRMHELTGSLNGSDTEWTLPIEDETVDTIVLGPDFTTDAGEIVAIDSVSSSGGQTTVTVTGRDLTTGDVVVGRSFTMSAEMSRPYRRDRNGIADVDAHIQIRKIAANYHNTGALTLRSKMRSRDDRTKAIDLDPIQERGSLIAWLTGNSADNRIFIESYSPKPCTVTSLEIFADYSPRFN